MVDVANWDQDLDPFVRVWVLFGLGFRRRGELVGGEHGLRIWFCLSGFAGFNLLEMGFSEFEIFLFGLIWYFGVLGFDDFFGFEKMVPLRFMILFLS